MNVIKTGYDTPLTYQSRGHEQLGILHCPTHGNGLGVLMMPAGYQYRIGPYRQNVLMAREFGAHGITSLRIDPPAVGDSDGDFLDFDLDQEVRAATAAMLHRCPYLNRVVLWGICGSASVVAIHLPRDLPIAGVILVNPWMRSEETLAKTYLKVYYVKKLFDPHFWGRLLSGSVDLRKSISSFFSIIRSAVGNTTAQGDSDAAPARETQSVTPANLARRMADGLEGFEGSVLIVLSEEDLTAQEFIEGANGSARWRKILTSKRVQLLHIPEADHVFSREKSRAVFLRGMVSWLDTLIPSDAGITCSCVPSSEIASEDT